MSMQTTLFPFSDPFGLMASISNLMAQGRQFSVCLYPQDRVTRAEGWALTYPPRSQVVRFRLAADETSEPKTAA